jgi:hypothetical protein
MVFHLARHVLRPSWRTLTATALAAAVVTVTCSGSSVTRSGPPQTNDVSQSWPKPLEELRVAVIDGFRQAAIDAPTRFTRMSMVQLNTWPSDWGATYVDPGGFLEPYRKLAAADRDRDVLIEDPIGDQYWSSEYVTSSGPVKFRCGFILHFATPMAGETRVTIYEMTPAIWMGETWGWAKEGILPGRHHDIRFVEPTVGDRRGVLAWIDSIVR